MVTLRLRPLITRGCLGDLFGVRGRDRPDR